MPILPRSGTVSGRAGVYDMKKNKQNTDEQKKNGFLTPRQIRYAVATAVLMFCLLGFSAAFVLRVYFMTESECYDDLLV